MRRRIQAFKLVGFFWVFFGVIVFLSALLVKEIHSKIINLLSGGILILMGAAFLYFEKKFK